MVFNLVRLMGCAQLPQTRPFLIPPGHPCPPKPHAFSREWTNSRHASLIKKFKSPRIFMLNFDPVYITKFHVLILDPTPLHLQTVLRITDNATWTKPENPDPISLLAGDSCSSLCLRFSDNQRLAENLSPPIDSQSECFVSDSMQLYKPRQVSTTGNQSFPTHCSRALKAQKHCDGMTRFVNGEGG